MLDPLVIGAPVDEYPLLLLVHAHAGRVTGRRGVLRVDREDGDFDLVLFEGDREHGVVVTLHDEGLASKEESEGWRHFAGTHGVSLTDGLLTRGLPEDAHLPGRPGTF